MYEVIDPNQWKRKSLYAFFKTYDNPTWDLISEVRITHFYNSIKEKGNPFFLSFLYAATAVGNTIEEMRCRISPEGEVRKYDRIHPGSTVLYENGTYGYGYFEFNPDYQSFLDSASTELEKQKSRQDVDPKDEVCPADNSLRTGNAGRSDATGSFTG